MESNGDKWNKCKINAKYYWTLTMFDDVWRCLMMFDTVWWTLKQRYVPCITCCYSFWWVHCLSALLEWCLSDAWVMLEWCLSDAWVIPEWCKTSDARAKKGSASERIFSVSFTCRRWELILGLCGSSQRDWPLHQRCLTTTPRTKWTLNGVKWR